MAIRSRSRSRTRDEPPLTDVLEVAKRAARSAGELIRGVLLGETQRTEVQATKSNATDLVTETDQKCEELVISLLKQAYPDHMIIGEESAGSEKYVLTEAPTWTIDPIDGTTNFVHHMALSCVIVAFLQNKEVRVGVVYDPMADELFWATKGGGAFLERAGGAPIPIQVSDTKATQQAVISMDPGYGRDPVSVSRFTTLQATLLKKGLRNVRIIGCTGLNMCWVACGRLDGGLEEGSWETNTGPKIWDFSAGKLLVQEAGGVTNDINLTTPQPSEESLNLLGRSFFCAATPELAKQLLQSVAEARAAVADA